MQQVRCVRAFGQYEPGDLSEVPDGAEFCPDFWEPAAGAATPAAPAPPAPAAGTGTPGPAQAVSAPPAAADSVKDGA